MTKPLRDPDLKALCALLEAENAALDRGDMQRAVALVADKQDLLERLEARGADLAERARDDAAFSAGLGALRDLLARNAARIERLRRVAGEMAGDLARLRDRHGLGGLYGANGGARANPVANPPRVNREA